MRYSFIKYLLHVLIHLKFPGKGIAFPRFGKLKIANFEKSYSGAVCIAPWCDADTVQCLYCVTARSILYAIHLSSRTCLGRINEPEGRHSTFYVLIVFHLIYSNNKTL